MVQWLRMHASTAEGMGLIPGQGSPHAVEGSQNKEYKCKHVHSLLWHLFSKYVPNFGGGEG